MSQYLCHVERSATIQFQITRICGAESKHPEEFSPIHAASGHSLPCSVCQNTLAAQRL